MESNRSRARALAAVVLAALGAGAAALPMLVFWSGQPASSDPFEGDVLRYYTGNAGSVRLGDVVWIAGMAALIASAALVRPWLRRLAGRWYVAGIATCAGLMIASAVVAFNMAGHADGGAISATSALRHWNLENALFDAAAFLLMVPMAAAAAGIDHERRFGSVMAGLGIATALLMVVPLSPWNFFAALAWIVAMTAFAVRAPKLEVTAERSPARPALVPAT